MSIATATHVTRDHVRIRAEENYEITVFNLVGADIEVIVVAKDGAEAARLVVAAPKADEQVRIDKATDGSVDFFYTRVPNAQV